VARALHPGGDARQRHPDQPDGRPGHLYRTAKPADPAPRQTPALTAIPYYAWTNRAAGAMQVWLREI
ncbi:MAG: hypothetical protein WBF31_22060, partial [Anaerolineae bacterium]